MKKVLLGAVAVIVLLLVGLGVLAFISPTEFKVERSIEISRPKAQVFLYLRSLRNQKQWSWVVKDPKMKLDYVGEDGEVGSIMKWDSEGEAGIGEQEIKKIVDGERIDLELRFEKPWKSTNQGWFITEAVSADKTKVRWGFSGEMPRPTNLVLLFTSFESIVGKDFEDGLVRLKEVVEIQDAPDK